MKYNLSSNQAHRISFDEAVEIYAQDCINAMPADYLAETPATEIAEEYYGEGFETDDETEAKARFMSVFTAAVNEAK